ncbi:beta-xylosidase/alpha-l-arabinosidase [Rhizomonospora bruguierae]|uniref:beta-xylosidase/alpha-l-arabinosidase n=1 Tax=Rhizomonospora bruguierae TaxID=1581705 RepID=UPI0020C0C44C|nr:glycoside hydrolase family 3 N-terminal domain-containing protein [Micromonospora sp. NBRC 107566]
MTGPVPAGPDRVATLLASMTLDEKLAQLVGLWSDVDARDDEVVAPFQDSMQGELPSFEEFARDGLGHVTRHYGTAPVDPVEASHRLAERQRWLVHHTRLGIPAIAHEECLTGLAAWRATSYPSPPAWGATFDPGLLERVGAQIGRTMRALGVHQGLAPVLDVVRDMRWGRVEETISEDPYLVGMIGSGYVRGMQSEGVVATLKHFVGYSNSRAGRNLAPVHAGPREVADVLLEPFEMAVLDGGAGSVMNSYSEIDGIPVAADPALLTGVLRDDWGFTGTVVADYFSVAFLHTLHRTAPDLAAAAAQALTAGIDVELPTGVAYLAPLAAAVRAGRVDEALVDRAVARVLRQKADLGLLDEDYRPVEVDRIDLDPPAGRALARELAEKSAILLANPGDLLPVPATAGLRIAVVGPNADDRHALFGGYAFANHVLPQHPGTDFGIEAPTIRAAIAAEFPTASVGFARGCTVDTADTGGFAEALRLATEADICVAVLGDRAGLFGRGTSGEGSDAASLRLPGVQAAFLAALAGTGTPVVAVLVTGRGYVLPEAAAGAAVIQAFFPGEEGAAAIARILSGAVNPSGRLPMSLPAVDGAQPYSYLHPALGEAASVSNLRTEPLFPFGHGLSYTSFEYRDFTSDTTVDVAGSLRCAVTVTNTGERAGEEVVQIYGSDLYASATRPLAQLLAFQRVPLDPGASARVEFTVPARRFAFTGPAGVRIVEPGAIEVSVRRSVRDVVATVTADLVGGVHRVTVADRRVAHAVVHPSERSSA